MTVVTLRYFEGCPHWENLARQLRELQGAFEFSLDYERVETTEQAQRLGFAGSPTVVVDGHDPFATDGEVAGLACRLYVTPDGLQGTPTFEQLREVFA